MVIEKPGVARGQKGFGSCEPTPKKHDRNWSNVGREEKKRGTVSVLIPRGWSRRRPDLREIGKESREEIL